MENMETWWTNDGTWWGKSMENTSKISKYQTRDYVLDSAWPNLMQFQHISISKECRQKKKYLDSVVCWYDWCPFCPFSINSRAVLARGSLLRPRNFSDSIKMLKLCPHPPERSWQCYVKAISPVDIAESTLLLFSSTVPTINQKNNMSHECSI